MIFFDHHYAFDALPIALTLGKKLRHATGALIPYAAHLDMGIDRNGLPSLRYKLRTLFFQQLTVKVRRANPNINILPVVRQFELESPKLKEIVDQKFSGANTKYLKTLTKYFPPKSSGRLCILSPTAGIAYPEKPVLHPQVYRSMDILHKKADRKLAFYFIGGYPGLRAHYHYLAPLLAKHTIVARGPFYLPINNYNQALVTVSSHLNQLRQAVQFTPPNYTQMNQK